VPLSRLKFGPEHVVVLLRKVCYVTYNTYLFRTAYLSNYAAFCGELPRSDDQPVIIPSQTLLFFSRLNAGERLCVWSLSHQSVPIDNTQAYSRSSRSLSPIARISNCPLFSPSPREFRRPCSTSCCHKYGSSVAAVATMGKCCGRSNWCCAGQYSGLSFGHVWPTLPSLACCP
jgi:hypothetical protein